MTADAKRQRTTLSWTLHKMNFAMNVLAMKGSLGQATLSRFLPSQLELCKRISFVSEEPKQLLTLSNLILILAINSTRLRIYQMQNLTVTTETSRAKSCPHAVTFIQPSTKSSFEALYFAV